MNNKLLQVYQNLAQEEKLRRNARNDILAFTKYTKPDYIVNWHHAIMADVLNKFVAGEIKNLMISAPPRHGKSELISRRLPAYLFGKFPDRNIIATSYNDDLAQEMTRDVQRIIDSDKYVNIFPDTKIMGDNVVLDKHEKWVKTLNKFEIVRKKGHYRSAGLLGGVTGKGCDYLLMDDFIKNYSESQSKPIKNRAWQEYKLTFRSRLEGAKQQLVTATRWAIDDLMGRILKFTTDDWTILNFEALKTNKKYYYDKRTTETALWDYRKTKEELLKEKELDPFAFDAMYQGSPPGKTGIVFKSVWWSYFDEIPRGPYSIVQSWDTAFKTGESNDYSVCTTWLKFINLYLLLDVFRARLIYPDLKNKAIELFNKYKPNTVLIEDKASGQSLIQDLRNSTRIPILAISIDRDKIARANACTGLFESGKVKLLRSGLWVPDYTEEMEDFKEGCEYDDQVDSTTQALNHMKQGNIDFDIDAGESQCEEEW